jgi:hypothetical protein
MRLFILGMLAAFTIALVTTTTPTQAGAHLDQWWQLVKAHR